MPNTPNSVVVLDQFGNLPVGIGIEGVVNGSNARAGTVGEFMQSILPVGGGGSVVNGTPTTYTDFVLTPGDWDVWGVTGTNPASDIVSAILSSISTVTNVLGDPSTSASESSSSASNMGGMVLPTPIVRLNVTAPTTVFLVGQVNFTGGGGIPVFGSISARRMR